MEVDGQPAPTLDAYARQLRDRDLERTAVDLIVRSADGVREVPLDPGPQESPAP